MAWFSGRKAKKEGVMFECHHRWVCGNVDEPCCEPASTTKASCEHFVFKRR